jgi:hypothetical protein
MTSKKVFFFLQKHGIGIPLTIVIVACLLLFSLIANLNSKTQLVLPLAIMMGVLFITTGFGFTGAWRTFIEQKRTLGVRAQILLLGLLILLSYPIMGVGQFAEQSIHAFVRPLATGVIVGAFIFGIGMQLVGSCTSGSLVCAGRGQSKAWIALLSMIVGATLAASHYSFWQSLPMLKPFSFIENFGWQSAALFNLSL